MTAMARRYTMACSHAVVLMASSIGVVRVTSMPLVNVLLIFQL